MHPLPAVCHAISFAHECQSSADDFFRSTFNTNLGWKHGLPPTALQFEHLAQTGGPDCNNTLFLVTTRHPLDWIASLYNETYVQGWVPRRDYTLREFVRAPAPCAARANRNGTLTNCPPWANPVRMWIEKVESYVRLAAMGCAVHNLRFVEHITQEDTAMCALVLSSGPFLGAGPGLWKDGVVQGCEGWNASHLVLSLVGGGVVTTGPGHARPIPPHGDVSWADADTRAWLAAELARMSPAAQQLTSSWNCSSTCCQRAGAIPLDTTWPFARGPERAARRGRRRGRGRAPAARGVMTAQCRYSYYSISVLARAPLLRRIVFTRRCEGVVLQRALDASHSQVQGVRFHLLSSGGGPLVRIRPQEAKRQLLAAPAHERPE